MSEVEQPSYVVERSSGAIELRRYPAIIVAQVHVRGERRSAIRDGFQIIAGYIFGANRGSQKIAMTAPVMQASSDGVMSNGNIAKASGGYWVVQFAMPRQWTLATLPAASDPRIELYTRPSATFASIRFSGLGGDETVERKTRELASFMADNKIKPAGAPILAFYNPPWTLPFLRRNEIMIEIAEKT